MNLLALKADQSGESYPSMNPLLLLYFLSYQELNVGSPELALPPISQTHTAPHLFCLYQIVNKMSKTEHYFKTIYSHRLGRRLDL